MTPSPEQLRQAVQNTLRQPRNRAPLICQALKNDKARWRRASSIIGQTIITEVTDEL